MIVDEGWRTSGLAGEITALIVEGAFCDLDVPIPRVCMPKCRSPMRDTWSRQLPQVDGIVQAVREVVGRHG